MSALHPQLQFLLVFGFILLLFLIENIYFFLIYVYIKAANSKHCLSPF